MTLAQTAEIVTAVKNMTNVTKGAPNSHHELSPSITSKEIADTKKLYVAMQDMINSFDTGHSTTCWSTGQYSYWNKGNKTG